MTKLLAVCFIALLAGFAIPTSAQEKHTLRLVQSIPLPGVKGRLDHMAADLEKKRLFVAAVTTKPAHADFISIPGGPESVIIDKNRGGAYTHLWTDTTIAIRFDL